MFVLNNEDRSIYCTRGDCCEFPVKHQFKQGDVVRFKATRKKDCGTVVIQRDFVVETDTDEITISLTGDDTKIGEVISKPTDYWYEVELNPDTHPQTIVGYDEDGAKVFKLFPEGKDVDAEDIEVVGKKTLQELVVYALEQAKEDEAFRGEPFTYEDFTPEQLESLKGDDGNPGVYLGSGDMPSDCNVQIDPEGEVITLLDAVTVAPQTFTEGQKAQARENIGAADSAFVGDSAAALDAIIEMQEALLNASGTKPDDYGTPYAVEYIKQELTEVAKAQARENIGAASATDLQKSKPVLLWENADIGSEMPEQIINLGDVSEYREYIVQTANHGQFRSKIGRFIHIGYNNISLGSNYVAFFNRGVVVHDDGTLLISPCRCWNKNDPEPITYNGQLVVEAVYGVKEVAE